MGYVSGSIVKERRPLAHYVVDDAVHTIFVDRSEEVAIISECHDLAP
jgi:hypothetical protein